jgi:hypothetical protein
MGNHRLLPNSPRRRPAERQAHHVHGRRREAVDLLFQGAVPAFDEMRRLFARQFDTPGRLALSALPPSFRSGVKCSARRSVLRA